MSLIIDVHGHYTTAPKALEEWRNKQIAGIKDPASMPKVSDLKISDDELREKFNAAIKAMKAEGVLNPLIEKHFGAAAKKF